MNRVHTLHAPGEDGAIVAEPPLREVGALLDENRRRLHRAGVSLLGSDWRYLQERARWEAIEAARKYLTQFGEPLPKASPQSLIMAGHQPELFHPGVWVKNFAICGLARQHGLTPINLIVDNDTVKSTSIRVPIRDESAPKRPMSAPCRSIAGRVRRRGSGAASSIRTCSRRFRNGLPRRCAAGSTSRCCRCSGPTGSPVDLRTSIPTSATASRRCGA